MVDNNRSELSLTRQAAIKILKEDVMCQKGWLNQLIGDSLNIAKDRIKAHEIAISSLLTDELYNLEHEDPNSVVMRAEYVALNLDYKAFRRSVENVKKQIEDFNVLSHYQGKTTEGFMLGVTRGLEISAEMLKQIIGEEKQDD